MSLDPQLLRALCWLGSALSVLAYGLALATRPSAVRMLNGSGLFFTGVALLASAGAVGSVAPAGRAAASWAVVFLLLSGLAQAVAALRNRRAWDGLDRRGGLSAAGG